jgi:hypothetical protein
MGGITAIYLWIVEGALIVFAVLISVGFSSVQTVSPFLAGTPFRKISGIGKNTAVHA